MEERRRFVRDCERAEMTMAEQCRVCGIARKTGYKIWRMNRFHGRQFRRSLRKSGPLGDESETSVGMKQAWSVLLPQIISLRA